MGSIKKEIDMYGIPGQWPTIGEPHRRRKVFARATDIYSRVEATENALDLALATTFPASDALSITQPGGGCTGNRDGPTEDDAAVCCLIRLNATLQMGF